MDKIRELEERKKEVAERIRKTIKIKHKAKLKAEKINQEYNSGNLTKLEHQQKIARHFEHKSPKEWFKYYDGYLNLYKKHYDSIERKIRIEKTISLLKILAISISIVVVLFIGIFYLSKANILFSPEIESYTHTLGITTNETIFYNWELEQPGKLSLVMLSGNAQGNGAFKVYLITKESEFLILDSSNIQSQNSITGRVVEESGEEENVSNQEPYEEPANLEIKLKTFFEECEETCNLLGENFNENSYTLKIEVTGLTLTLDELIYGVSPLEETINLPEQEEEKEEILEEPEQPTIESEKKEIHYKAVINKPVKWIKVIDKNEDLSNIEIPKEAREITVKTNGEVQQAIEDLQNYEETINQADRKDILSGVLTGKAIKETDIENKIIEKEDKKIIDLEEVAENSKEIAVEYYTPGPVAIERETDKGKELLISAPDELKYEDVLSFVEIPEILDVGKEYLVKVYWKEEKIFVEAESYDLDENGKLDYVEWIVPHLSNQTFEIYIEVLNIQSYPTVGGEWAVEFTTIGKADLTIRTIDGTTWDDVLEDKDLKFFEVKCGEKIFNYEWIENSVVVRNYECDETSFEISKVLTPGKHHLEFEFGGAKAWANNAAEDFKVQRGYTIMPNGQLATTITSGVHYTAPTGPAFIRIINTRLSGMGRTSGGGSQNSDDYTVYISNPANIGTSVTFQRLGNINNNRISWEIIEYTGPVGGANEIQIREASSLIFGTSSLTGDSSSIPGILDDSDVVVFITGQANSDTGTKNVNYGMHTSEWLPGTDQARFTRGEAGRASRVSYAVVEFTGANWKIQRADHAYTASGVWQTETISPINELNKAFLHTQHRSGTGMQGIDEQGEEAYLFDTSTIRFQLEPGAGTTNQHTVAWVIENTQTEGIPMNVVHMNGARANNIGDSEDTWLQGITLNPTAIMTTISIMGENARSSGTGTAFPRGFNTLQIKDLNTIEFKRSDIGQEQTYRFSVVEWPTSILNQPPNLPEGIYYDGESCPTESIDTEINLQGHHDTSGEPDPEGDPVDYYLEAFYTQGSCSNKASGSCSECGNFESLCTGCNYAGCIWEGGTTDIFFDDFENGLLINWEQDSQNRWFEDPRSYGGGSMSAGIDGRDTGASNAWLKLTRTFDLSSYISANVSAQIYIESGLDNNEYVCLDYSCNGGETWNRNFGGDNSVGGLCQDGSQLGNIDIENNWREVTFDVETACSFLPSNFLIRFRGTMDGAAEDANVDFIKITADIPYDCEGALDCSGLSESKCEACSQCEWAGTQGWYQITPTDNHPEGESVSWDTSSIPDQSEVLFRVRAQDDSGLTSDYFQDTCTASISHSANLPPSDPNSITCNGKSCNFPVDASVTIKAGGSVDPNLGDSITYYIEANYFDGLSTDWRLVGTHAKEGSIVWETSGLPPQNNVHFRAWAEDNYGLSSGTFTPSAPPYLTIDHTANSPPTINIKSIDNLGEYNLGQNNYEIDLIPGSYTPVEIVFDIIDSNSYTEIDDINTLEITYYGPEGIQYSGNYYDCTSITDDGGSTKTYYCELDVQYFDPYGLWSATINIQDTQGDAGENERGFYINLLRSITLSSELIDFENVNPGESNIESSSSLTISNDGNSDVPGNSMIQITSGNLCNFGDTECIPGGDATTQIFQVAKQDDSDFCSSDDSDGIWLRADQPTNIPNLVLPKDDIFGEPYSSENIKFCFKQVPSPLGAQDYSTNYGSGSDWIFSIISNFWILILKIGGLQLFLVAVSPRKKLKREELLELLGENLEDIIDLVKENKIKSKISEVKIPLEIFKQNISPAEAVSKYLKENKELKFSEIAIAINRDQRTVRINYINAVKKRKGRIKINGESLSIPLDVFKDRKLSMLESVVKYMKASGESNSSIAEVLGKSISNIWTLSKRAEEKIKN